MRIERVEYDAAVVAREVAAVGLPSEFADKTRDRGLTMDGSLSHAAGRCGSAGRLRARVCPLRRCDHERAIRRRAGPVVVSEDGAPPVSDLASVRAT